jgi:predicted Zn-dependent protease
MALNIRHSALGRVVCLLALIAGLAFPCPSLAENVSFIRDAEIEHYLRELATPIYRAADIDPGSVHIYIVQSSDVNAFVAEGMNQFFYTSLLQLTETPEQLAGVIAHETGHIAGGHLIRGREAMENASAEAMIGALLGVAAGLATRNGQATVATLGGAETIAERNLLSFSRSQEASADAAGMSFLDRANMSGQGMLEFMQKLAGQDIVSSSRQSEYVRTHPLTQDRIDAIRHHLENAKARPPLDPKFKAMHDRMKAKLQGYLQPEAALLRTTDKDPRANVRYTRAIAFYRTNNLPRALALVDGLLQDEPNNPYFFELKAQMLFERGRIEEAIPLYQKALAGLPDSSLMHVAYAHALMESKDPSKLDAAIQNLLEANRIEPHDQETWHLLASAFGRKAEIAKDPQFEGMASYALAEEALARGANNEARQLAERALKVLTRGSPYWVKAQDVKLSTESERQH